MREVSLVNLSKGWRVEHFCCEMSIVFCYYLFSYFSLFFVCVCYNFLWLICNFFLYYLIKNEINIIRKKEKVYSNAVIYLQAKPSHLVCVTHDETIIIYGSGSWLTCYHTKIKKHFYRNYYEMGCHERIQEIWFSQKN